MVLILELVVASIAVALILLSLKTLQAIKHLGVGRSFWMPVAVSGFLFFFGSMTAILFELNVTLTAYTGEVVQVSRLLALTILVGGVYGYSRRVTKNLGERFSPPKRVVEEDKPFVEAPVGRVVGQVAEVDTPVVQAPEPPPVPIQEKIMEEKSLGDEVEPRCRYEFGHLQTLPKDAPIPDECFSCDKIIACKHSLAKRVESQTSSS